MGVVTQIKGQTIPLPAQVRRLMDWHDGDVVMLEVLDQHTLTVTLSETWPRPAAQPIEQRKRERLAHHQRKARERNMAAKDEDYYAAMTPVIEELTHEFSDLWTMWKRQC